METKNRGIRALIIAALIVAVLGISVAFASLSQTLNINSTGTIRAAGWDVKWTAASGSKITGGSAVSAGSSDLTVPSATMTISGIVLENPEDKVQWVFTASNTGDIDAKLESITSLLVKNITFDGDESSNLTEDDIIVTLTKNPSGAIVAGDTLNASATQQYILTVEFNPEAEEVPSESVYISITIQFPWVQK